MQEMVVVWVSNSARGGFRLLLHGSPCQRAAADPALGTEPLATGSN